MVLHACGGARSTPKDRNQVLRGEGQGGPDLSQSIESSVIDDAFRMFTGIPWLCHDCGMDPPNKEIT